MRNISILLISFLATSVFAQKIEKYSLEEAVTYAQQNAYAIQDTDDAIAKAKHKIWETTTMGLPQINASVDYQYFIEKPVQLMPASAFDITGATVGIMQAYYDLLPTHAPVAAEGFIEMSFGTTQNIGASATLTQLLFNGSYLVGLQSSKVFLKISEGVKEKTEAAIKEGVSNAYAGVLMIDEGVAILEKNKKNLEKTIHDTNEIYKNGFAEEQDVEQLQLTLSSINNEISNLKRMKTYNLNMLKYIMGIPIEENIVLTQNLENLLLKKEDLSITNNAFDFSKHIDFRIAENTTKANELMVKYEQSKALPSLVAFVNYGLTANNDEFKFFNDDQKWLDTSLFGVSLDIPIFSSFARRSRIQQAKIELDKTKRAQSETAQKLKLAHQTALLSYENALNTYSTSKESLALAERIEKKENIKFFEGVSSSFALSNAQTQMYQHQQKYLQAVFELINKKVALETALDK